MIAWEYAAIIFKGYSLTKFMKQDLFIKKQFEMVKIVYSIVVVEIFSVGGEPSSTRSP